jgi:hypothetical protein
MQTDRANNSSLVWRRDFATARAALARDDVATARPILDELASARPDDPEIRLCVAWTRGRLAAVQTEDDRKALEALARRVLGEGQLLALPLCILGHAALRQGDLRVARRQFRRAADADPTLIDARRGARIAEDRLARRAAGSIRSDAVAAVRERRVMLAGFACALSALSFVSMHLLG